MSIRFRLFLTLLAIPTIGYGQSTLNFPKLFSSSELPNTGFAVVNPGAASSVVSFKLFSAAGELVDSRTLSDSDPNPRYKAIAAGGNRVFLGTEIFASAGSGGWVQVTSGTGGLQGFWLNYNSNLSLIDGAEAASTATDLVIPLVAGQTELNVANPNPSPTPFTVKLYGATGEELADAVTPTILTANGVYQTQVSALFPSADLLQARYIKITTGGNSVAATALIRGYLVPVDTAVVNGIDRSTAGSGASFPHVINGAGWTTVIGITNLSASEQTVTITFTPKTDAPYSPVTVTRQLSGSASLRATAEELFNFPADFRDGWVQVSGTAPVTGFAAYGWPDGGALAVVPVASAKSSLLFAHMADGPAGPTSWQTGLAFLNTSPAPANIEIYAMTAEGALIGSNKNVVLPPGRKISDQLHNWIPETRGVNGGFIFVRTANNIPLFGIELFYTEDLRILSSVSAGGLAAGITYTPPSPSAPLKLTAVSPARVARGGTLTLTGTGFSPTARNDMVAFTTATGIVETAASSASATSLTLTVPASAISGPIMIRNGSQTSPAQIVEIIATTTLLQSPVDVAAGTSANGVDIYVAGPAATLNATEIGVFDVSATSYLWGTSSIDLPRGQTKEVVVSGAGISQANGTRLAISGNGTTLTDVRYDINRVIVRVTVDAAAAAGPRNVIVTNSNLDTAVLTGGLFIR